MAGQTISSDCDPPRGGDHPAKKRSPRTPPPVSRREKIPVSGQLTC
ncbi:DNase [Escherichia coli]|nr:DNase [Escherichia coli]